MRPLAPLDAAIGIHARRAHVVVLGVGLHVGLEIKILRCIRRGRGIRGTQAQAGNGQRLYFVVHGVGSLALEDAVTAQRARPHALHSPLPLIEPRPPMLNGGMPFGRRDGVELGEPQLLGLPQPACVSNGAAGGSR